MKVCEKLRKQHRKTTVFEYLISDRDACKITLVTMVWAVTHCSSDYVGFPEIFDLKSSILLRTSETVVTSKCQ